MLSRSLRSLKGTFRNSKNRRSGARPSIELLEDRLTPATFTPTTFADVAISSLAAVDAQGHITNQPGDPITLRSATIAANAANSAGGDTIVLAAGTYTLSIPGDADDRGNVSFNPLIGDLDISDGNLTIQGAGAGATTIQQTTGADRILTDNINGNAGVIFNLTGLTLTGGVDTSAGGGGGALYTGSRLGTTSITNCDFVDNQEAGGVDNGNGGGAIFHAGGNLTITNCTFGGAGASAPNGSDQGGGAIRYEAGDYSGLDANDPAALTISNSTFTDNANTGGFGGGALVISNVNNLTEVTANISGCTFQGNTSSLNGGAIEVDGGNVNVTTSTFNANSAALGGGAIRSYQNTASTNVAPNTSVSLSKFVSNSAANGQVLDSGCVGTFTANNDWWGSSAGPAANATYVEPGASAITISDFLQSSASAIGVWDDFNGNAQHTGISTVAAQPTDQILWQTSVNLNGTYFYHTGEPVFTPNDTVIVPVKVTSGGNTAGANNFELEAFNGNTGVLLWTLPSQYVMPSYSWMPPYQPVYDPVTDRVYFPGPGGTLYYISHPDSTSTPTPVQVAFYGTASYTANESSFNASIFINTPLTADNSGNVFFGFTETGSNPSGISDGGIASVSAAGVGNFVTTGAAVGVGTGAPALGSAPALSNDGSILYVAVVDSNGSYLVGVNAATLAPEYSVLLSVPNSDTGVELINVSTAAPMVAPDGTVFMGVFADNYDGSRGFMTHYSANLATEYTPGAFGWDDTASIIPTSMVPSYTGTSSYLILTKYNNYVAAETGSSGGNGVNEIAILDPYATQTDPNNDPNPNMLVMKQILTVTSPTEDSDYVNSGYPDATREWCTNGTAVDPATDSVFINNEDGYSYRWNLATNTITQAVEITDGYGEPYTPTAIGPNGVVYAINGGTLFALGGYANYTLTNNSSLTPSVAGQSVTFTTTLASTNGGAVPTGSITYSYTSGVNNPQNSTPITLGTVSLVNGQASLTTSALIPDHYHIVASYSGDATDGYAAGSTTLVQVVLANPIATVTSSASPITVGQSVTFTATVNPNGVSFVPLGTVSFMDGSTLLGTVKLNALDQSTSSSSSQTATFTTSSLSAGTHSIEVVYSGDLNFAGKTSSPLTETVLISTTTTITSNTPNPSTAGQNVAFVVTVAPNTVPNGELVQLDNNGVPISGATGTLSGGTVTINVTSLPVGTDSITAVYAGDANYQASTSAPVSQTVNSGSTAITITSVVVNGNTAAAASLAITSISEGYDSGDGLNDLVTVTTAGNNGFVNENLVTVAGFSSPNAGYNGSYNITSISSNSFSYVDPNSTTLATLSNTGTISNALLGNGNQRSMVSNIVYTFSAPVNLAGASGTFNIAKTQNVSVNGSANGTVGTLPTLNWSNPSGDQKTWVVTFSGSGVSGGGSIADGVYNISLSAADVTTASGGAVTLTPYNNDGSGNDLETFYRLTGDVQGYATNGNQASVSSTDYNSARSAYTSGSIPGQSLYKPWFDLQGAASSDDISATDYNTIRSRFTSTVNYANFTPTI